MTALDLVHPCLASAFVALLVVAYLCRWVASGARFVSDSFERRRSRRWHPEPKPVDPLARFRAVCPECGGDYTCQAHRDPAAPMAEQARAGLLWIPPYFPAFRRREGEP